MRKPRVIILDDEEIVLYNLREWMSKKGFEVLIFNEPKVCPIQGNNGEYCTKEKQCADILITDYKMPQISGIELLQKQSKRRCPIDIRNKTIISGSTDDEIKKTTYELRCSLFKKPFRLSEISDWLSECKKRIDLSVPLCSL
jgi:response regulator RpfG family c-di-GMP phosphodiesterase